MPPKPKKEKKVFRTVEQAEAEWTSSRLDKYISDYSAKIEAEKSPSPG